MEASPSTKFEDSHPDQQSIGFCLGRRREGERSGERKKRRRSIGDGKYGKPSVPTTQTIEKDLHIATRETIAAGGSTDQRSAVSSLESQAQYIGMPMIYGPIAVSLSLDQQARQRSDKHGNRMTAREYRCLHPEIQVTDPSSINDEEQKQYDTESVDRRS